MMILLVVAKNIIRSVDDEKEKYINRRMSKLSEGNNKWSKSDTSERVILVAHGMFLHIMQASLSGN